MKKLIKRFFIIGITGFICMSSIHIIQANDKIQTIIDGMTLEQKITQMIMPDFRQWKTSSQSSLQDMTVLNEEVANIIDTYDFGGVILFANNVKETEQTAKLTTDLQNAAISNKAGNGNIPLLIGVDQEGGIVYRLGSGTALPGNMAIGASGDTEAAKKAGQIIGRELSALGINVNFAPALDVNSNPHNPVIGLRSFSSDPNLTASLGTSMIHGMQEYNIATAAKHFPGHGDTSTDSHTKLPLVDKTYEELSKLELIPFQAAVNQGVDMLMTAHIQFPKIEKDTAISKKDGSIINIPATLSDDVITGIIRNKMNYDGVVITDAMNMDAIASHFGEAEAVLMAMQADVDICLMPTILRSTADLAKLDSIIDYIKAAVADNKLSEETLNKSVRRILELKEKRGILDYSNSYPGWDQKLAKAKAEVGSTLNRKIEREISGQAVTITKNEDNILPFNPKSNEKVLLFGAYANELPGMELSMRRLINENVIPQDVQYESFRYALGTSNEDMFAKIDTSDYVVVISEISDSLQFVQSHWLTSKPTDIVNYANSKNIPVVVMSIAKPYDVANYPNAKSVLAVYGNKGMDPTEGLQPDLAFGPNIPAGIEAIFGGIEIQGTLPVDIPTIVDGGMDTSKIEYPIGYGLTYKDVVKNISVNLPDSPVTVEEKFTASILLNDLQSISNDPYKVIATINTDDFTIVENENYTIDGNHVTFTLPGMNTKQKSSLPTLEIVLQGNHEKQDIPVIKTIEVIDTKDRVFSMGEDAYIESVMTILKKQDTKEPETPTIPDDKKPDDKKSTITGAKTTSTGDETAIVMILAGFVISGLSLVYYTYRKKRIH